MNSAHVRQSRPYSGLGVQVKVVKLFEVVPASLGSSKDVDHCVEVCKVRDLIFKGLGFRVYDSGEARLRTGMV